MKKVLLLCLTILALVSCSKSVSGIDTSIEDTEEAYITEDDSLVKEVYVSVLEPKKSDIDYNYTFNEVNTINYSEDQDPKVRVIFQEGKDGVIGRNNYGYGLTQSNATMEQRGQSARIAPLKSYKINLNSKAPWDNYVTVNLNKHPFDNLRIRNKLAFDLIKDIPNITSARVQFVNLFIKDFSEGDYSNIYQDYGLFTQVENIDTRYLENHNLDKNGYLYKVENFEFKRYEDIIKNVNDNDYSKKAFETVLEIKGQNDHTKLINMLDAVNSNLVNINSVIDVYFDRENLLTWLALNILTDNVDTQSRNYFLYSPSDLNVWYFLPWDYDKGLGGYEDERPIWQRGVSNHWGNVLINKFLRSNDNLNQLTAKIEELASIMNKDKIEKYIELYKPISKKFLSELPDSTLSDSDEEIEEDFNELLNSIETNKEEYYKSLNRPMPVFLNDPFATGNFIEFNWSESYHFNDKKFTYSFELSDSPSFENIIFKKDNLLDNELIIRKVKPGKYYYRVYIIDEDGNKSDAFDIYYDEDSSLYYYGIKEFFIT